MSTITLTDPTADRFLCQRRAALGRANEVRLARAQIKRDIKTGRLSAHALLIDPPPCLVNAQVSELLLAIPKLGRVKVNRVLRRCEISPSVSIGFLSERRRRELAAWLGGR